MPSEKRQIVSIFLIKPGIGENDCISADQTNALVRLDLSPTVGFKGSAWVRKSSVKKPEWLPFVETGLGAPLADMYSASSSCLLTLKLTCGLFCIPFGHAHHWIADNAIQRGFGLKVVLNSVPENQLKTVDREQFESVKLKTRSQASSLSSIDGFGVDTSRDLVETVTGIPKNLDFALSVTGSDKLLINSIIEFKDLGGKCEQAYKLYNSKEYQKSFPWLDKFKRIQDPDEIKKLDESLIASIVDKVGLNPVYLTAPSALDQVGHIGFHYKKLGAEAKPDLRMQDYLLARRRKTPITIETLKNDKIIHAFASNGEVRLHRISVYKCILFERHHQNSLQILTNGEWFEVDNGYVNEINTALNLIPETSILALPPAKEGELEEDYNERAATGSNGALALMDQKFIYFGTSRSKYELCDLLSEKKVLVHVKRGSQSSLLSHLFNQGTHTSSLLPIPEFRKLAIVQTPGSHKKVLEQDFNASDWEVVFAIITNTDKPIKSALPFFSRQSLVNAKQNISSRGYKISIMKIPITSGV